MKEQDLNKKTNKAVSTATSSKRKATQKKSVKGSENAAPRKSVSKKNKSDVEQPMEFSRSLPSTPDTKSSADSGNTLTIRHENAKSRGSGARTILGMTKPAMALVGLFALGSLGAGLWGWLTIPGLYDQIEELEYQVDRLEVEVDRFEELNQQLNESIAELQGINQDLRSSVTDLQKENDRLQKLNDNLESIVGFLNETSAVIGETLDDVTEYLAEQITVNRVIVLETLENTFQQDMNNWDCAYRDIFRSEPFVADENAPIGLNSLPAVLNYVQDRILDEMCASRSDFEAYLGQQYNYAFLTSNQLYQGVATYTTNIFNYYFPDPGQSGITPEQWAEADYNCANLPPYLS